MAMHFYTLRCSTPPVAMMNDPSNESTTLPNHVMETDLNRSKTGFTFDDRMLLHRDLEDDHPEKSARLESILHRLHETGLLDQCVHVEAAENLSVDPLNAVHTRQHLEFMSSLKGTDNESLLEIAHSMDSVYLCSDSDVSAKVAALCTVSIACRIAQGSLRNGFALVRPPGHHAEPNQAMGFCLYNNVAVALKELQRQKLAKKIMILDWDVHHGNGTQKIFAEDPDVLFISIHRHDGGKFYPNGPLGSPLYVGEGQGSGKTVNIGWDGPGATDADYFSAFLQVVLPIAEEFSPDFIIVSAGFDAAEGDPIGLCNVTPRGFAQMTQFLMGMASGKVLLVLEGGYNVPVVADCAEACMRTLLGEPLRSRSVPDGGPSTDATTAVTATLVAQRPYWRSLRPRCYDLPEASSDVFSLQDVTDTFWKSRCTKDHNLIPMPIADDYLRDMLANRVFVSDNLLTNASCIVVFAHESGPLIFGNLDSNVVDARMAKLSLPFNSYLAEAQALNYSIIDVCLPAHKWQLRQDHTGSSQELLVLNDLVLYLWDYFLALSETRNIFFVSSGLAAYSICNLIDKRVASYKVRGIVVISPTLYLPVASSENSDWYHKNSLIIIPTKKPEGVAIPTNHAFGCCISSGSEDPSEISRVVSRSKDRIFQFIRDRLLK